MKYIDSHTHLHFNMFDADREVVLARAREAEVGLINVGTDYEASKMAVALANDNKDMWATVGLHPTDWNLGFNENLFAELARQPRVVAIGECGLDYFHQTSAEDKAKQAEILLKQFDLAVEVGKPLMIHCRNAYDDLIPLLKANFLNRYTNYPGNIHFFTGDWPTAQKFLDLGFSLSFPGVITFTHDYDEVVKNAPAEYILAETDAPFATPVPYRGKRNEPAYVVEVVKKMAELRGVSQEAMAETTLENTKRLFKLAID